MLLLSLISQCSFSTMLIETGQIKRCYSFLTYWVGLPTESAEVPLEPTQIGILIMKVIFLTYQ